MVAVVKPGDTEPSAEHERRRRRGVHAEHAQPGLLQGVHDPALGAHGRPEGRLELGLDRCVVYASIPASMGYMAGLDLLKVPMIPQRERMGASMGILNHTGR